MLYCKKIRRTLVATLYCVVSFCQLALHSSFSNPDAIKGSEIRTQCININVTPATHPCKCFNGPVHPEDWCYMALGQAYTGGAPKIRDCVYHPQMLCDEGNNDCGDVWACPGYNCNSITISPPAGVPGSRPCNDAGKGTCNKTFGKCTNGPPFDLSS
jgi:hypothetical protein